MILDPHVQETVNYFISQLYSSKSDGDMNLLAQIVLSGGGGGSSFRSAWDRQSFTI